MFQIYHTYKKAKTCTRITSFHKFASSDIVRTRRYPGLLGYSPIPLNSPLDWLRIFFENAEMLHASIPRNTKNGEPAGCNSGRFPDGLKKCFLCFFLLLFFLFPVDLKEFINIVFCPLIILHILLRVMILAVEFFLFCQYFGVLSIQVFDL